jgi:hypothetical protein
MGEEVDMTRKLRRRLIPLLLAAAAAAAARPPVTLAETTAAIQRSPPGGWRVVMRDETLYWCTNQPSFGSRTRKEVRCLTPDQYDALMISSKKIAEDIRRTAPAPTGG